MPKHTYTFTKKRHNLTQILTDHDLASLGDAYVNFAYSLALSDRIGKPSGAKTKGSMLAEALRKAGLRKYLPSRMTRHMLADAAEALIVYAWLDGDITLEECVVVLEKDDDITSGLSQLLNIIKTRIKLF
ncbi:hypothetical protein HXY33_08990 [Candidatus Bathyarchaeota archaeon]|nr:hypothetical protein [Candidatus Bathyarchaeota archaeon]